jgi:hypothetical protein
MNGGFAPLAIHPARLREHPIDNLEAAIASDTVDTVVLQLPSSEAVKSSGFFIKKKPPRTNLATARKLENRSVEVNADS